MHVEDQEIAEVFGTPELPNLLLDLDRTLQQGGVPALGAVLQICERRVDGFNSAALGTDTVSALGEAAVMLMGLVHKILRAPRTQALLPSAQVVLCTDAAVKVLGCLQTTAATAAASAAPAAEGRMIVTTGGFRSFHHDRFHLGDYRPCNLKDWLQALPSADPKERFSEEQIKDLLQKWEEKCPKVRGMAHAKVLEMIEAAYKKDNKGQVPEKVKTDVQNMPIKAIDANVVDDEAVLALLLYSLELYTQDPDSEDPTKKRPCQYQIYGEFNRFCRCWAHAEEEEPLRAEWELFKPLFYHLNTAIHALPAVNAVLYRGGGYGVEAHDYPLGEKGAWGGAISASGDRNQAVSFVSKEGLESVSQGSYFVLLSNEARPMFHISDFPEEMEYLHPLEAQFEVCGVLPASILQMLALSVNIVTLKLAGKPLPLDLHLDALDGMSFIYNGLETSYVSPSVKVHPDAVELLDIHEETTAFVEDPAGKVLLVAAPAGAGKTSYALLLAKRTRHQDRLWLFISLPSVENPFAENSLVRHLKKAFSFEEEQLQELQKRRLVLILDSLDEVQIQREKPTQSWWDANGFDGWTDVKLIVTCRQEHTSDYGRCMEKRTERYLQPFGREQIRSYIHKRLRMSKTESGAPPSQSGGRGLSGSGQPVAITGPSPAPETESEIQREVEEVMQNIDRARIRTLYSRPFPLSMAMDLYASQQNVFATTSRFDLYGTWLRWWFKQKAAGSKTESVEDDLREAEKLAWELHCGNVSHTKVTYHIPPFCWALTSPYPICISIPPPLSPAPCLIHSIPIAIFIPIAFSFSLLSGPPSVF